MTDFLWTMGPFLLPLLLLSFYSVGLIFQKATEFRRLRPWTDEALAQAVETAARGQSLTLTGENDPRAAALDRDLAPALRQARAQTLVSALGSKLGYFPALANVATLTGLFGTVCGMIGAFLSLRSQGGADPAALAGGLGQALAATALGLICAIPSLGAHAIFQKRLQVVTDQLETVLSVYPDGPNA